MIRIRCALVAASILAAPVFTTAPAFALSQITGEDGTVSPGREGIVTVPLPPVLGEEPDGPIEPAPSVPAPSGAIGTDDAPTVPSPAPDTPPEQPTAGEEGAQRPPAADLPPIEIARGDDGLPPPVRDLRRKLMDVARSGDIEQLRPYFQTGAEPTVVSATMPDQDPVTTLRDASGDGEGVELLAILLETLEAGHVRLDPNGDNEIYVWPYFTQVDLGALTKPQLVELFELVTAGDYQRMVANGSYDFYRVGISPEGRFEFFVDGD